MKITEKNANPIAGKIPMIVKNNATEISSPNIPIERYTNLLIDYR